MVRRIFVLFTPLAITIGYLAVAAETVETLGGADDPDDTGGSDDTENIDDSGDPKSVGDPDDTGAYDYIVVQDGSGDYETIQAAIDGAKSFPPERVRVLVRDGVYDEKVGVRAWNPDITLVDESAEETVIAHDDHFERIDREHNSTFFTYTLKVRGNDFHARDLTVENSASPVGQTIALHVDADRTIFEDCRFLGHQNTIYAAGGGTCQYLSDCYVERMTDFIFGGATAVSEDCHVHSKADSHVTAAPASAGEPFGFVFLNHELTTDPDVSEVHLGRPQRNHARIVFIRTWMGSHVRSDGWHNWSRPNAEATVEYTEFDSRGPSTEGGRVSWATALTEDEAAQYSKANVLGPASGREWWDWEE